MRPRDRGARAGDARRIEYTLLESAKLVGVEPRDYLRAGAENALTNKPAVLPHSSRKQLRAA